MDKDDRIVLGIWFFFIALVFTAMYCSEAQTPDPDTPFVPYFSWEVDIEPEEKVCDQVVEVTEPSDIKTLCWKDTQKVLSDDGTTVKFMLLPAGCVAIVMYRFKIELDVYQDKQCDILFHNKGGGYEIVPNEQPKTGV